MSLCRNTAARLWSWVRSIGLVRTKSIRARLLDAIAMAGGPTDRAELGAVGIYRGGVCGITEFAVGRDRILFQGDAEDQDSRWRCDLRSRDQQTGGTKSSVSKRCEHLQADT